MPSVTKPSVARCQGLSGWRPESFEEDGRAGLGLLRSEEHTSELQSPCNLVCRLLLEKKKKENVEYVLQPPLLHTDLPQLSNALHCSTFPFVHYNLLCRSHIKDDRTSSIS